MKKLLLLFVLSTGLLRAYAPYEIQIPSQKIEDVLKIGDSALAKEIKFRKTKNPNIVLDVKDFRVLEIKYITEKNSEDRFCWLVKYANPPSINDEFYFIVRNDGSSSLKSELRY